MKRFVSLLAALVAPPLGVLLWQGRGLLLWVVGLLWVAGLAIFFLWMAGPGFLLVVATTVLALLVVLVARPSPGKAV